MEHSDMLVRFLVITRVMYPRIGSIRLRVPFQIENFYNPIPDGFTFENFFHWHARNMCSRHAVQFMDSIP